MRKLMMILALILASSSAFAGSFNGSGTFVRSYNWTQDAANGIPISAPRFDTEDNGFATGLSTCVTRDGQSPPNANLPMAGFRHTGVGLATSRTNYAAASQVQDNTFAYCADAGTTSNTYVVGSNPVVFPAYTTGMLVWFRAPITNTASATLNVNTLGAIEIKKNGVTSLTAGDIVSGTYYGMLYDGITNSFMPMTGIGNPSLTATVQSVGLAAPSVFNVSSTPITTSGTISLSFVIQPSHTIFAGPLVDPSATPAFRRISATDLGNSPTAITFLRGDGVWATPTVLQTVYASISTVVPVTAITPQDASIPQVGETGQVVTVSITPQSASSTLRISGFVTGSSAASVGVQPFLFRDAGVNAIAATNGVTTQANGTNNVFSAAIGKDVAALSTASTTFSLNIGLAAATTVYVNGTNTGSTLFGGVLGSWIMVQEVR